MSSSSAISGPVKRRRRSAAIASIRVCGVRLARTRQAELRSNSPHADASRNLATHLEHVLDDVLNSAAAAEIDQPWSSTNPTIRRRCVNVSAALACNFIRVLLQRLGLRQPPASKEARMNNLLRNYT
jgi:hypothetical protein